jgi:uncharacterized repeat protein (TIGR03803 family)
MQSKRLSIGLRAALAIFAVTPLVTGTCAAAQVENSSGNLYGTTSVGGEYSYGTVFELSPQNGRRLDGEGSE